MKRKKKIPVPHESIWESIQSDSPYWQWQNGSPEYEDEDMNEAHVRIDVIRPTENLAFRDIEESKKD